MYNVFFERLDMEKRIDANRGRNDGKRGKPPPDWVLNLKNKHYDVPELVTLSQRNPRTVRNIMQKYAVEIEYIIADDGKSRATYKWNKEHFLKIYYNQD